MISVEQLVGRERVTYDLSGCMSCDLRSEKNGT